MQGSGGLFGEATVKKVCSLVNTQNEELEAYRSLMKRQHELVGGSVIFGQCIVCSFPVDVGNLPHGSATCDFDDCMFVVKCGRDACASKNTNNSQDCELCGCKFCVSHVEATCLVACCKVRVCSFCRGTCLYCHATFCDRHPSIRGHACSENVENEAGAH